MRKLFRFLPLLFLLLGCQAKLPIATSEMDLFTRFEQTPGQSQLKPLRYQNETYWHLEDLRHNVRVGIFGYQNSLVILMLSIENKGQDVIQPEEYAIKLYDGRDLKPIKILTRQDIQVIKARMAGQAGKGIQDQVIESGLQVFSNITKLPTGNLLLKAAQEALDNYFSFRPIYPGEKREGILCFLADYKLEYPISLQINVRDDWYDMQFLPKPQKK